MRDIKLVLIETDIKDIKLEEIAKIEALKQKAKKVFESEMKLDKKNAAFIKKIVSEVESSKDLTSIEHDEWYSQYTRVYFSELIDTKSELQKELLQDYMREEFFCEVDFKNDCLTYSIGPAILINHEGDVLDQDSGKWFLKKSDYETEAELFEAIELYMNKTGHFPSVVKCDYYGNAFYVNTTGKE